MDPVLAEMVGAWLERLLQPLWRVYVRALNLPVLACVLLDCVAGGAYAFRAMGATHSVATMLLALAMGIACAAFGIASAFAWWEKVRLEREPARVPVRVPARLDGPR